MPTSDEPIRLHVHWGMKVIAVLEILLFPFLAYASWQLGLLGPSIVLTLFTFLAIWVFFLADTKIDVNQNEIQVTAPHGVYVMSWAEISFVETQGQFVYFFGENKAIGYNLLFAGKGKDEFQNYVANLIHQRQIPQGRPPNISNSQLQKLLKNTKVRGWKLF